MNHSTSSPSHSDSRGFARPGLVILLVSVLGLFLEMMLIRWLGTEIRIFAYLQNSVLVVCLLGLGLGCLTSRQPIRARQTLIPVAILCVLLSLPLTRNVFASISEMLSILQDFLIWSRAIVADPLHATLWVVFGLALTYCVLALLLDAFVPLGRLLGRLMDEHPNTIAAYSINVGGSLLGIWLFVLLSAWYLTPAIWCLILSFLFLALLFATGRISLGNTAWLLVIAIPVWFWGAGPGVVETIWSPYQKLDLKLPQGEARTGEYVIDVNSVFFQWLVDGRDREQDPEWPEVNHYELPLLLHPRPRRHLIVGAGAGNDVAGSLRQGTPEITAVEIDPGVLELGRKYHPEDPYSADHVTVILDDARSYFANSREEFDVISFGLLDSHTATTMMNARLDHYVYTLESFEQAKRLLSDDGILTVHFAVPKLFVADRLATVLRDVFGAEPIVLWPQEPRSGWGGMMLVSGNLESVSQAVRAQPDLARVLDQFQKGFSLDLTLSTAPATDDWPYLYLERPRIPVIFFLMGGLMLLLFWRSLKNWNGRAILSGWNMDHWHFFFLGAAFLLLEVTNISRAAVALGNTWQVNAVIVSGVLAMVLLANLIAGWFKQLPMRPFYFLLCASCLVLYLEDLSSFTLLPYHLKAAGVGLLASFPMLFSGIVFIQSFTQTPHKDKALGANLFGALVGALLHSVSFVIGVKGVLLIVGLIYVCALATRPLPMAARAAPGSVPETY